MIIDGLYQLNYYVVSSFKCHEEVSEDNSPNQVVVLKVLLTLPN